MKLGLLCAFALTTVACGGAVESVAVPPPTSTRCPVQPPIGTCPPGTDYERSFACFGELDPGDPVPYGCKASIPSTESSEAGWFVVCCPKETVAFR